MTFFDELPDHARAFCGPTVGTASLVARALDADRRSSVDFWTLLSPGAVPHIEEMAQRAHSSTVRNFGKTIVLYTPIYLSNFCVNECLYCGFAARNRIRRSRMSLEEVDREARLVRATGLRHVLVLTGDSRAMSPVEYVARCAVVLCASFTSISVEIYALDSDEYACLVGAGVDGLTLYQETYDRDLYARVHPAGPKRDYRYRLDAPERACEAGVRFVNLGVLLGLGDWRDDVFLLGLHAAYLQRRFPDVELSVSLPRLRPHEGRYDGARPVSDLDFVQALVALRLFLPRVGITISTRERAGFRDHLLPLGVTRMSAGSSTAVRGRIDPSAEPPQFDISDHRDVPSIKQAIESRGYKAIFKDWHPFDRAGAIGNGESYHERSLSPH